MRLWVLAQELIGHAVFSHRTPCATTITALVQPPRRRVPSRPQSASATSWRRSTSDDARPDGRHCSARSATPRCCWAPCSSPEQIAHSARPRRRHRCRSSATSTTWSTASPPDSSAATRCASPRPCAVAGSRPSPEDVFVERLLGLQAHPGTGAARQELRAAAWSTVPANAALRAAVRAPPSRCPRPPSSTRPACGWPASSCDIAPAVTLIEP